MNAERRMAAIRALREQEIANPSEAVMDWADTILTSAGDEYERDDMEAVDLGDSLAEGTMLTVDVKSALQAMADTPNLWWRASERGDANTPAELTLAVFFELGSRIGAAEIGRLRKAHA